MKILVSACLLGVNCKYSGGNNKVEKLYRGLKDITFIPVCPEQLGGLATPRLPSEILGPQGGEAVLAHTAKVQNNKGEDISKQFLLGAEETLKIAKLYNCQAAILKERSPSCGSSHIYDGSFSGRTKEGTGVTAALLKSNGIKILSEENFEGFIEELAREV